MRRIKFLFILIAFFVINLLPLFSATVNAAGATLFLSPSSGEYTQGGTITAKVMVNSGGSPGINASEGSLKFDPEYLSVSRLSDSGTIFKLWVTDPTYSNSAGTISYGGGLPGAYTGNAGLIFSIVFNVKKAGNTSVTFSSGSVLAQDGKGTDVVEGYGNATYVLIEPKEEEPKPEPTKPEPEEKEVVRGILPPKPEINSKTHKEDDVWYSNNDPEFSWKMLAELTGVSISITDEAESDPGPIPDGIIETKKFDDVEDGEWYIHVKYQNKAGWGMVAHKKFLVDTKSPILNGVRVDNDGDDNNPSPELVFNASDETSGIAYYELVKGDEVKTLETGMISNGRYKMDRVDPGEHNIQLIIYDNAQNIASSSIDFFVEPLKSPIISDIPNIIKTNEELVIRGKSFYPSVNINISIGTSDKDIKVFTTRTDEEGNWSYFHKEKLEKGNYEIQAWIVDDRGAQSFKTSKHILVVIAPSIIESYGLVIILILLLIILGLITYIWFIKHKFGEERIRIARETDEAKLKLGEIFTALREEVEELMELADKKTGLSESEKRVKDKLQDALDISEEFIGKEIEDVNKEIYLKRKTK
ncbi:MAG: cohesin domain-containing protein [Patescibacteria group bacterium]|jgi:hypothetical protein|nr:cohesin domain-containing protein [Patescibacteria group bacterium]